jgi:type VI protein secretion system component Hcp
VSFSNLSFSASTSQASPLLLLATADGKHIKSGRLTVAKKGRRQQDYIEIELTDVLAADRRRRADFRRRAGVRYSYASARSAVMSGLQWGMG